MCGCCAMHQGLVWRAAGEPVGGISAGGKTKRSFELAWTSRCRKAVLVEGKQAAKKECRCKLEFV